MSARTVNSNLPQAMVCLAYMAAGLALSVSWAQLRQVLQMQSGLPSGEYISVALPAAILFGSCVLFRMLGHLWNRQARAKTYGVAIAFVMLGAFINEGVSIMTSAMSLTMGANARIQKDIEQSDQYQASQQLSAATTAAAGRLAQNINDMPARYYKRGNQTAAQLQSLIDSQTRLNESTNNGSASVTQKTLDEFGGTLGMSGDRLKTTWAWLLALCLSLIVMAVQVGLGTLSDGRLKEKQDSDITTGTGEGLPPKKHTGLSVVQ